MRIKPITVVLFLLPCFALFALVYMAPIVIVLATSITTWKASAPMQFSGLSNYIRALQDPSVLTALKNTAIWCGLQATVHVGLGTTLAIILSRKRRFWKFFRTVYMIPNVISMAALAIIMLNVFKADVGPVNSFIGLITGRPFSMNWYFMLNTAFLTVTMGWLPFAGLIAILMLAAIQSVSHDVIEAARIDGATQAGIDFRISLPLCRASLGTAVIIAATSMLKEFEMIYLTTGGGPGNATLNLPLYLYKTALNENNYGYANTMGVMLISAGVLIVFTINRLFRMDEADM